MSVTGDRRRPSLACRHLHPDDAGVQSATARADGRGDEGFSLLEVMTAMAIMTVFFTIFTGSVLTMYHSSAHTESVANTSAQLSQAYARLESQVRYASYVSLPGQGASDGNWYVELQDTTTTPALCRQLRIDQASQQLQERSWTNPAAPSPWQPLGSGIANGSAVPGVLQPFVLTTATGTVRSAQLTVKLVSADGGAAATVSSQSSVTFTALNSTPASPIGGICAGMRP